MLCSQFQMQLELSCTPTNHSRELCAVAQQADWLRDRLGDRNGIPGTTRFLKLRLSAEPDGLALRGS
jgi:hypothetical protein